MFSISGMFDGEQVRVVRKQVPLGFPPEEERIKQCLPFNETYLAVQIIVLCPLFVSVLNLVWQRLLAA